MKSVKTRPCLVVWADTCSASQAWMEAKEVAEFAKTEAIAYSFGVVIGETPTRLLMAPTINEHGTAASPWSIPKGCIKKVIWLKGLPKLPELA